MFSRYVCVTTVRPICGILAVLESLLQCALIQSLQVCNDFGSLASKWDRTMKLVLTSTIEILPNDGSMAACSADDGPRCNGGYALFSHSVVNGQLPSYIRWLWPWTKAVGRCMESCICHHLYEMPTSCSQLVNNSENNTRQAMRIAAQRWQTLRAGLFCRGLTRWLANHRFGG